MRTKKPFPKVLKIIIWAVLGLLLIVLITAGVGLLIIYHHTGTIISSGESRDYLLYIPDSYNPDTPAPLVIAIHGYAEWPGHQAQISHWNQLADEYGFIVVYPSGTNLPKRWRISGWADPGVDPLVDVIFISDLIDHLEGEYNIDPQRIYANGLSNGGGMSFMLLCYLSDRIAAVGFVSGAYLLPWESCNPCRPVPAIVFHGTADPIVPFEGGPSSSFELPFPNIPAWVATLAEQRGCAPSPVDLPEAGAVTGVQYTGCEEDAEVVFYTIHGGGHTWPGGEGMPEVITGITNYDIDATRLMWEFFQAHPLGE
jgi:polyhydroxybutyrate depolymerase